MSSFALVLVVIAAFAHAGWNLASKRAGTSGIAFVWSFGVLAGLLLTPFALPIMVQSEASWHAWLLVGGVSGLIHAAYFSALQGGYARGDLSIVYPLARGTGPLLSVVLAMILFHERPGGLGLLGAAAVVGGVLLIALTAGSGRSQSGSTVAGVAFGIITGLLIAGYTLWDAHGIQEAGVHPVALMWMTSVTEAIVLAPLALRQRGKVTTVWRTHLREVVVVAVLSPVSYVLVLFAFQHAPVSLIAPARELSVVLVSLVGTLVLKEAAIRRRLIGALTVFVGIVLLAIS